MPVTEKHTHEVVLEPLNQSGQSFILYGLRQEEVSFNVFSPSKRSVALNQVTQQRKVNGRTFTLTFTIFEAENRRPHRSGIYESGGEKNPTAMEQLELVRRLARFHEEGVLLAYHGIALDVSRCAIKDFNASLVYTHGQGTITFEEREPPSLDLGEIAIDVEALLLAAQEVEEKDRAPVEETDGDLSPEDQLNLTRIFINGKNKTGAGPRFALRTDDAILQQFGIYGLKAGGLTVKEGLPLSKQRSPARQIFPDSRKKKVPKLYVLPFSEATPGGRPGGFNNSLSLSVSVAGIVIWLDMKIEGFAAKWKYEIKAWAVQEPTADPRTSTQGNSDPDQDGPTTVATVDPDQKPYSIQGWVVHGIEQQIADKISFAFVGKGGKAPATGSLLTGGKADLIAKSTQIKQFALVFADYR